MKNIPIWDLSRVRLSAKRAQTVYNIFVFDYLLLFVQGSNRRQIIKADSLSYEVGMDEFRDFSEYVVDLARRNGKEFENSRFLDVRRGKLTTRLVGDRFPISALLLTALYLVFVSLAIIGMAIEGLKPVFLFAILLFGALAVGSAYYLLSTQRMFCKVCKGHRYFLRRKTQMTCMVCKQPFEEEFRSPIKES